MHSPAQSARKIFQPIKVNSLTVMASGGLVDVTDKPHRGEVRHALTLAPGIARSIAAALLKAADAAEGLPAGFAS